MAGNIGRGFFAMGRRNQPRDKRGRWTSYGSGANRIVNSPRNLTKQEQIAADVMANKKFRSDRARIAEMVKRGVSTEADFVELVGRARDKQRSKKK